MNIMKKLRRALQKTVRTFRQQVLPRGDFSEAQLRAYFTKNNSFKITILLFSLIAGAWCFIMGSLWFPKDTLFQYVGSIFLLVAFCLWLLIEYSIKVPSDAEYDAWVYNKAWESFRRAWLKVDEEGRLEQITEQTLSIHGFALKGTKQAHKYREQDLLWKVGKDKAKRYSINIFTFFVPMEHQLAVFVFDINAANHRDHRAFVQQYFFVDVVGITTEDELDLIDKDGVEHTYRTESFALRICDGNRISATIRSIPIDDGRNLDTYNLPDTDVDRTISQIRLMLRAKKQGPGTAA